MRHQLSGRKLNRTKSHRQALFSNMSVSLIMHEQIKTTLPKAKELRPIVEKLITMGKNGSLHQRRLLISKLKDAGVANKVMTTLAERYKDRQGGYIRILKAGFRYGDAAPMAIIELVDREIVQAPQTIETELGEIKAAPAKAKKVAKPAAAKSSVKDSVKSSVKASAKKTTAQRKPSI
jgi:large subunit ribosomal protein L17